MISFFLRPAKRDWYSQQLNGTEKKRITFFLKLLFVLFSAHIIMMMYLENWSFWTACWVTVVTITTVGYGDTVPVTVLGQFATTVLMCFGGVVVFAVATGDYVAYQISKKQRMITGHWDWKMKNHLLIINVPSQGGGRYLSRIIEELHKTPELNNIPTQILTARYKDGLPPGIRDKGAVHIHGRATSEKGLMYAGAHKAKYILVLADDYNDPTVDSRTLDVLDRLKSMNVKAKILAEYVSDFNKERFKKYAASVMRPVRSFPEIVCRALLDPGSEEILQDFFTHNGDFIKRYDTPIANKTWSMVSFGLSQLDMGMAIAYIESGTGAIKINPKGSQPVDASAIYIFVKDERIPTPQEIATAFQS